MFYFEIISLLRFHNDDDDHHLPQFYQRAISSTGDCLGKKANWNWRVLSTVYTYRRVNFYGFLRNEKVLHQLALLLMPCLVLWKCFFMVIYFFSYERLPISHSTSLHSRLRQFIMLLFHRTLSCQHSVSSTEMALLCM